MYVLRKNRILRLMLILLVMACVAAIPFLFGEYALAQETTDPGDWPERFGNWVGNLILSIAGAFTWLGGQLFDTAFDELVLGMGRLIQLESSIGASINLTWTIIRDFANLAFIFGFIYIGVKTILDYENANTKRFLVTLIIAALLINFSLFVTKFVVDASNFLATEIYTQVLGDNDSSIGLIFADTMGIVSLYDSPDPETFANLTTAGNIWFFIMGALFLFVAAFVLAAGAILLVIRFVALVLIMIFSPVLFAAMVFPQTQERAKQLWSKLLEYAFFAPVYLLFLFISLKILQASQQTLGGDSFSDALTNQVDSFGVILNFVIIIMFMIFALIASKRLSIYGGSNAVSWGEKTARGAGRYVSRRAGGITFGAAAAAGRGTIGKAAYNLRSSQFMQSNLAKGGLSGTIARAVDTAAQGTAQSSFDVRRIGGVGKRLDIGEGTKGGYEQRLKDIAKSEKERADSLKLDESIFENYGPEVKNLRDEYKKTEKERNRLYEDLSTASTDTERARITADIRNVEQTLNKFTSTRQEDFVGDEYKQYQAYRAAERVAKNSRKRQYASNLEAGNFYQSFIRTAAENKNAADEIRKSMAKTDNDKIIDAVKESSRSTDTE